MGIKLALDFPPEPLGDRDIIGIGHEWNAAIS